MTVHAVIGNQHWGGVIQLLPQSSIGMTQSISFPLHHSNMNLIVILINELINRLLINFWYEVSTRFNY